ncbi:MAG: cytidine deaminase [Halobacteriovoraceae bacterium]|nr:cytidine deaminase [Halobacteriovoraceae bacterium]|tara:strand:+ start:22486 stop:22908 length:423 start_codon:yes stop_codon:yes gene_type:complete
MKVDKKVQEALELAIKARKNAYADLTKVKVGAAIKIKGHDEIYSGCNVEYIVTGISTCAERNALGNIVTHKGKPELEFVVVTSNTEPALYPCGVCLQAMAEFCQSDLKIYIADDTQVIDQTTFKDLMPHQYSELPKVKSE